MRIPRDFLFLIIAPWTLGLAVALYESWYDLAIPWPIVQRILLSWLYSGIFFMMLAGISLFALRFAVAVSLGIRCPTCRAASELRCVKIRPFGRRYFVCRTCGGKWTSHALSDGLRPIRPEDERYYPYRPEREPPDPASALAQPLDGLREESSAEDDPGGLAKVLRERKAERARRLAGKNQAFGLSDVRRSPATAPEHLP